MGCMVREWPRVSGLLGLLGKVVWSVGIVWCSEKVAMGLWASGDKWFGVWSWYSERVDMGLWASWPLGKSAVDCRVGVSIVSGHGSLGLWASWGKWSREWGVGWYSERVYMSLWASGHLRKSGLECGVWVGIVREWPWVSGPLGLSGKVEWSVGYGLVE